MKYIFLVFVLAFNINYAQTITIGVLTDEDSPEVQPLFEQLKAEVSAVVGQGKTVIFNKPLQNNFSLDKAKSNYQLLTNSNVDVILTFGVLDNIVISQQEAFSKPTIVFGSINSDFLKLVPEQKTSQVNNLTYIITPLSYTKDLDAFKTLYDYKNVGIIVDDYVIDALPLESVLDPYFTSENKSYQLISLSKNGINNNDLNGVDAVYLAGGFQLSDTDFKALTNSINTKKIPSFSASRVKDVELGILATNQPQTNLDQFFRRIALNIEAISNGTNASELPLLLEYKNKLTINFNTAKQIDFPLRYAMLGTADFIGGTNNDKKNQNALSIIDIMNGVIDNNLSLSASKSGVLLTEQDVKIAKSGYLPNVTASANGVYLDPRVAEISNGANPEISTSGSVVAEQLVYSESASANIDIKEELQKAQQATYNVGELDALQNASVAYFNALILKTNTTIQNQNLQLTKRNLELAEQNFEGGASGKSDILRFRSQLAQNTQNLIDAGNQLKQAYFTINQLMNNSINTEIDIDNAVLSKGVFKNYKYEDFYQILDNPKLQPALIEFLVQEAKKNAPELQNLNHNLNVINRTYKLNDTGRFIPTVALQGQYNLAITKSGKGSTLPTGFPVAPDGTYNVGLNISLPIFNQNQRNINRQTAKIQEEQLGFEKQNVELNIEKNVNDIILDLISQIANIEISKVSEETAKESLELTQNAYKQGAVPVIQLIDAQTNYLQAQLASATANYNYLITSMQLERSIGYFFLMHTQEENQQFIQNVNAYILSKN